MEDLNSSISVLFPASFVAVVSDTCQVSLRQRFPKCSMVSLLRLIPHISDVNASLRDPSNGVTQHAVNKVRFRITDLEELSQEVSQASKDKRQLWAVSSHDPQACNDQSPWFSSWKDLFLTSLERFDHEFIGAYFGCIFIILSTQVDEFRNEVTILQTRVNSYSSRLKFFFSSGIRYFVVLHVDPSISANDVTSKQAYQDLLSMYGSGCVFLLDVSSPNLIVTLEESLDQQPSAKQVSLLEHKMTNMALGSNSINFDDNNWNKAVGTVNATPLLDPLSPLLEQLPSFTSREDSQIEDSNHENNIDNCKMYKKAVKPVVCQELNELLEKCLRQLIESSLVPFIDKQVKVLYDAVSARKGIRKSLKQFLGMTGGQLVNSSVVKGPVTFMYRLESEEMQQRKMADMVMSIGLYDLANRFYHSARDDFRADGACIYFAGASEMTAVTAFLTKKFSREKHHNFDNAVTTYLDICRHYDLACRSTLLIDDCMRSMYPNETAHFFIRMTSEDCDLRSALFLEQAALSFKESSSRSRKASFHYVLAGHRYNKCHLKRHALHCYRVFDKKHWYAAVEHVNHTLSKLMLALSCNGLTKETQESFDDSNLKSSLRYQAIEVLKNNSEKVIFFNDLVKELNGEEVARIVYLPNIPVVRSVRREPIEGTFTRRDGRHTCFLNEHLVVNMDIANGFPIRLIDVTLFTSDDQQEMVSCSVVSAVELEGDFREKSVAFLVTPIETGNFDILGIEYTTGSASNVMRCRRHFHHKTLNQLRFFSLKSLPVIQVNLRIGSYADNVDAVEMMSGETCHMEITVNGNDSSWTPSSIKLYTNAQLFKDGIDLKQTSSEVVVPLVWMQSNVFHLRSPIESRRHVITFRIEYHDNKDSRSTTRKVEVYVRECFVVECVVQNVVSLRNTLSSMIILRGKEGSSVQVWPGLTAHILLDSIINWSSFSRQGFLSLEETSQSFLNSNSSCHQILLFP